MKTYQMIVKSAGQIEEVLGYTFKDKGLLARAFVHRSYFNEHRDEVEAHNERLEFLGDSVLGLLVSEFLFREFEKHSEGQLSHMRSYLVDATTCAQLLCSIRLDTWVLLGRGEQANEGRGRDTILADLFEALLGAIYLDGGMEKARAFYFTRFGSMFKEMVIQPMRNRKGELQDWAQKNFQQTPVYRVLEEVGPDHAKRFTVGVFLDEKMIGQGRGMSKKEAEMEAAKHAVEGANG